MPFPPKSHPLLFLSPSTPARPNSDPGPALNALLPSLDHHSPPVPSPLDSLNMQMALLSRKIGGQGLSLPPSHLITPPITSGFSSSSIAPSCQ
ncbi:hypothetical protein K438DRAFT_1996709 [Mycena galopus ATCC 62051]|nr:hypothetical protein K438DRAFT_1996709 [Mycena galopus ATCC 62051]